MLYTKEQVINGLATYIDNEVMTKLPTSGKWLVGTVVALGIGNISELMENPMIKMLGVVNNDGLWDIEKLANVLKSTASRYGNLQLNIPIIGKMTFSGEDIDAMKRYIN